MGVLALIASMIFFAFPGWGQTTFDAASVKAADPTHRGMTIVDDPSTLTIRSATLLNCMMLAYEVKDYQIVGPDWMRIEIYDIVAKTGAPAGAELHRSMLQGLLADRFKLKVHREMREIPIYELVVGSHGPKFQQAKQLTGQNPFKGFVIQGEISMSKLAEAISGPWMRRPVLDRTGLTGEFELKFDPMAYLSTDSGVDGRPDMELAIERALKELGLELKPYKAPFELLVVDRAEKIPSAN